MTEKKGKKTPSLRESDTLSKSFCPRGNGARRLRRTKNGDEGGDGERREFKFRHDRESCASKIEAQQNGDRESRMERQLKEADEKERGLVVEMMERERKGTGTGTGTSRVRARGRGRGRRWMKWVGN
jgi:hypothetical protein